MGPWTTSWLRVGLAGLMLLPVVMWRREAHLLVRHARMLMVVGFFNSGLPFALYGYALMQLSTGLAASKYVKKGGALSVMADLRERRGPKVPFFGHLAPSNPFPAMLAVTLNKPVFIAHVQREAGVRFKIRVDEIQVAQSGDREADILETTARIQLALENNIRSRPGEWMWSLGRWI